MNANISYLNLPPAALYFQNFDGTGSNLESQNGLVSSSSSTTFSSTLPSVKANSYLPQSSTYCSTKDCTLNHPSVPMEHLHFVPPQPDQNHLLGPSLPQESYEYYNNQQLHPSTSYQEQYTPQVQLQPRLPTLAPPVVQPNLEITNEEPIEEYGIRKPFISKLGYLLRNAEQFADVIQWNEEGTIFIIAPSIRFTTEVLPEIFSHSSFSAFTRQLHTYNFRHLNFQELSSTFTHSPDTTTPLKELSAWTSPLFQRDFPMLANRMIPTPSKARSAHQQMKHAMLLERGTNSSRLSVPRRRSSAVPPPPPPPPSSVPLPGSLPPLVYPLLPAPFLTSSSSSTIARYAGMDSA